MKKFYFETMFKMYATGCRKVAKLLRSAASAAEMVELLATMMEDEEVFKIAMENTVLLYPTPAYVQKVFARQLELAREHRDAKVVSI